MPRLHLPTPSPIDVLPVRARFTWELIRRPLSGVAESADACWIHEEGGGLVAAVAHPVGYEATGPGLAARAIEVVQREGAAPFGRVFARAHAALLGSRGVSLALVRIGGRRLEFLSVGTIRGTIDDGVARVLPVQAGIVGEGSVIAPAPVTASWRHAAVLLLTRDGVVESWADSPAGAASLTTAAIVRALIGPRGRPPDDGTMIVIRGTHDGSWTAARRQGGRTAGSSDSP